MEQKRETVGKISSELIEKAPESRDPIELQRAMTKEFIDELNKCVVDNQHKYIGDFYVIVITKRERLMPNVLRNYFFPRQSCPTPEYDQSVFRYNRSTGDLIYLWTVPSKDACYYLKDHMLEVVPEEQDLLRYVLAFFDGSLLRYAKKMNKEKYDSPILA